jgi:tetratricopeptide (TPR) repeat protein
MSALRLPLLSGTLVVLGLLLGGADGCASDPNVEGAKLYVRQENYEQALANLDKALEQNPDNAEALRLKGEVLRRQTDGMQSDPVGRRPMVEQAVAALNRAMMVDVENADAAQNELVQLWGQEVNNGISFLNKTDATTEDILNGAAAFENSTIAQPDSALGYFNQAFALIRAEQSEAAIEPLQAAIERGETSADAYLYLARIYASMENDDLVISTLEPVQAEFADNDDIRIELLNAYQRTDQTDRALQAYQDLIERDPSNPLYLYNYGALLRNQERFDESIEVLMQAAELYESMGEDNARVYYNIGAAYQNKSVQLAEQADAARDAGDEAEAERLTTERKALLEQALPSYVRAREIEEMDGAPLERTCTALFQVYAQLLRNDDAREAAECAGIDLDN